MRDFSIDYKVDELIRENIRLQCDLTGALNKIHEYADMIKELEDYIRFYQMRVSGLNDNEVKEELKDILTKKWRGKFAVNQRKEREMYR